MKTTTFLTFIPLLVGLIPASAQEWSLFMADREDGYVLEASTKNGIVAFMHDGKRAAGHLRIPNDSTLEIAGKAYPLHALRTVSTATKQRQVTGGIMAGVGGALIAGGIVVGATGEHDTGNTLGALESTTNWAITGVMAGAGLLILIAGAKTASPKTYSVEEYEFIIEPRPVSQKERRAARNIPSNTHQP